MLPHLVTTAVAGSFAASAVAAPAAGEAGRLVSQYRAVWNEPPSRTPANHSVDGPLLGNGDLKVALGGRPRELRFYLAKNDFWRLKSQAGASAPVCFGQLAVQIPALREASYRVEQRWDAPATTGTFKGEDLTVRMRSEVAATRNVLLVELAAEGRSVEVEAWLHVASGRGSVSKAACRGDIVLGQREFLDEVDLVTGAAAAFKVLGAPATPARQGASSAAPEKQSFRINLGREQYRGGRWGFRGAVDDLRLYDRALDERQLKELVEGAAPEGAVHLWPMDVPPEGAAPVEVVPGRVGKAWRFTGNSDCFVDCGVLTVPVAPVTVACWIRIDDADKEANYLLSCGEWNTGVSLGLSAGKLRFSVAGKYVESAVLPRGEWLHVAGTWNGSELCAYVNGFRIGRVGDTPASAGVRFTLQPGKPVTLVLVMDSRFHNEHYAEAVTEALPGLAELPAVRRAHAAWWADYWAKSWVELGDAELEKAYCRSLYGMGACSRDPHFPPGIFGWVTTDNPQWAGDYHLNYNHLAPYYALYSANRLEQADPEDAPLLDFRDRGRWYAANVTQTRGVLFPVGIGPLGIETTRSPPRHQNANVEKGGLFFQQRSNSAYCLVNIAQRWRTTYDPAYGREVYPLVRDVVDFWEDYLTWQTEEQRYVIVGDAIHEGSGQDVNPLLSLGLVRNALDLALDMSGELGVDEDRPAKWQHLLTHLSLWPTQQREGKTVFRYTERGTAWWRNNTLGIQHIYPGNALGLDSDPHWLDVARNTLTVMQRWNDFNGSNSFFPAAVRVGYDPDTILEKLRAYADSTYPNGFLRGNPHGLENFSTVPNTINEMLCMSHVPVGDPHRPSSVLRVFPVWPKNHDARFVNIRSWGAFLVSSELKKGQVQYVRIQSERGRDCTVVNPWPGCEVTLLGRGRKEALTGERFTFETSEGETLLLTVAR